jgi:hypothetical protein
MPKPVPIETLQRLVVAGSQAGLTLEQMISLLRSGFTAEQALKLVETGLFGPVREAEHTPRRVM